MKLNLHLILLTRSQTHNQQLISENFWPKQFHVKKTQVKKKTECGSQMNRLHKKCKNGKTPTRNRFVTNKREN